jgi:hypothetical protein
MQFKQNLDFHCISRQLQQSELTTEIKKLIELCICVEIHLNFVSDREEYKKTVPSRVVLI